MKQGCIFVMYKYAFWYGESNFSGKESNFSGYIVYLFEGF